MVKKDIFFSVIAALVLGNAGNENSKAFIENLAAEFPEDRFLKKQIGK